MDIFEKMWCVEDNPHFFSSKPGRECRPDSLLSPSFSLLLQVVTSFIGTLCPLEAWCMKVNSPQSNHLWTCTMRTRPDFLSGLSLPFDLWSPFLFCILLSVSILGERQCFPGTGWGSGLQSTPRWGFEGCFIAWAASQHGKPPQSWPLNMAPRSLAVSREEAGPRGEDCFANGLWIITCCSVLGWCWGF